MLVRIRLLRSVNTPRGVPRPRQIALAVSALLSPAAVVALALACWRLGADLNLTGHFVISEGLFSHWQVWLALAAFLQAGASLSSRYGHGAKGPSPKSYEGRDQATP